MIYPYLISEYSGSPSTKGSVVPDAIPDDYEYEEFQKRPVEFQWGAKIPMRDGVHLHSTIFRPRNQKAPLPVIFTLTPYIADSYMERALYFAKNDYVFAIVDSRGRGNSEGIFEPMANEGRDGHDVTEWLARQSWCDGNVGMWGGSYAGLNQWSTAKEFPQHLKTIVPAAAAHPGVDFPFFNNVFLPFIFQWLTFTSGVTANSHIFENASFWIRKFSELQEEGLAFEKLDQVVGNTTTFFQKWLEHPTPDAYWDAMVPTEDEYGKIKIPILSITGHYDGDQAGAMTFYRRHMRHGSEESKGKHYLVLGPWDHPGTRTPKREFGGLEIGAQGLVDLNRLHKEWYDWTLKNSNDRPEFLKDRVSYYVNGSDEWNCASSLESISNSSLRLYLGSRKEATDGLEKASNLILSREKPRDEEEPDAYVYDPLDKSHIEVEKEKIGSFITDRAFARQLFLNGLVYDSEPLLEDTEITGNARFTAFIELDVPDTDFFVELDEIKADGSRIMLTLDLKRARFRNSLVKAELVRPGEINRYEFVTFYFFSRKIARGSKLRLLLTSPNSIHFQKNYNSGGRVSAESAKDARVANVVLYHDAKNPSYLELPTVPTSRQVYHRGNVSR